MLGVFKRMFGSPAAGLEVTKAVVSGIDKLFYTPEEKAENGLQARKEAAMAIIAWQESTKGQNLARRFIALLVIVSNIFFVFMLSLLIIVGQEDKAAAVGKLYDDSNFDLMSLLVVGFYFGGPSIQKGAGALWDMAIKRKQGATK